MQLDDPLPQVGTATAPGHDLVRRLSTRYLLLLVAVMSLVIADQALLQPVLLRMNGHAPAINVAGRQRMLSQKLTKAALALQSAQDESTRAMYQDELRDTLREWSAAHESLQRGATDQSIAQLSSPNIDAAWARLEPHFRRMQSSAVLLGSKSALSTREVSAAVAVIMEHETSFLRIMDQLVSLTEAQALAEIRRLRFLALAVACTIVALVSAVGWFVIRPATRVICGQVNELEQQVTVRTRNLDETLAALRSEITERQASQARNQALAAQLAHANRIESVGHLAGGLAHELNQPLATIVNYTEACHLTLEQPLDNAGHDRLRDFIERVRQASLRAGGIVARIRKFVQPGSTATMPTELLALVHEVIELCQAEAHCAETGLVFQPPAEGDIVVEVDSIQIQQVLINLIQNALDAVRDVPKERRQIILQVKVQADTVQIDLADFGRGLGDLDAERLFTPFHTTKADGLGIGLSICRSIIEQHHGTIWAQSLSPQGAQFSFVLPRLINHVTERPRQPDRVCR